MSSDTSASAKATHYPEHLADRVAMVAMRAMIGLQPPADLGPAGRTAFDELMTKTPAAEGVTVDRMTKAARDGTSPSPVAACVMSPWTDLTLSGDSIESRATHDPLLSRSALEDARQLYLGLANAKDPRVSPLYGDLAGLPPVLLHVGEDEILLDDARRYADLVAKSGSAAELHVWQGMVHVFPANLALLRAAVEALDVAAEFLRGHVAP
jgi:alpha/beta hydrolase fold